ncbi:MAG: hypothetical protein J2P47_07140 [Acetobacteraceae bacterium]|nr:hypothetical protein [Acetobacteraceae bacterium]
MNDCAYGAEPSAFARRWLVHATISKRSPPHSRTRTARSCDCKINAVIAAPFMGELAEYEKKHH